jgi:SAM-dependent methyltransferase
MSQPPTPAGEPEIHEHRQAAESFGADAERYDRTRPPYPSALVQRIVAASPGPDVLDVGCGTGTAARQFRAVGSHGKLARLLEGIGAAIDAMGGSFTMPYTTVAVTAVRPQPVTSGMRS